jgi:hypothetical protein
MNNNSPFRTISRPSASTHAQDDNSKHMICVAKVKKNTYINKKRRREKYINSMHSFDCFLF